MRRHLLSDSKHALIAMLAAAVFISLPARADLVEGRDYVRLAVPQKPEATDKVEVLEFFSYGCPHCYSMHPHLSEWSAKLPSKAVLVRVPVAFGRREWGLLSRTYYTLQSLGELKRLDMALFEAIHKDNQRLVDEAGVTAWAVKNGIDAGKFTAAFNSFGVSRSVSTAEKLSRDYAIQSIPKIVVNGRYMVEAKEAKSYDDLFGVADQLIAKAAAEK